jgi:hypothetical protein
MVPRLEFFVQHVTNQWRCTYISLSLTENNEIKRKMKKGRCSDKKEVNTEKKNENSIEMKRLNRKKKSSLAFSS